MAVHPDLPGIEVVVLVKDGPLEEFEDKEEENDKSISPKTSETTKTMSKYIKSVADQAFGIKYFLRHPFEMDCPMLGFDIYIDGRRLAQRGVQNHNYNGSHQHLVRGVMDVEREKDPGTLRQFRFSKVDITLDDNAYTRVEQDMKRMANVGCIRVEVWRMEEGEKFAWKSRLSGQLGEISTREVHEKALKGQPKYHGISLGHVQTIPVPMVKWKASKMGKYPIAYFTFKYRSELALKELLIIERTPEPDDSKTPPRTSEIHDPDQLDAEKERQVESFTRNFVQSSPRQNANIKRERDGEEGDLGLAKRPRKTEERIMIDLTDD